MTSRDLDRLSDQLVEGIISEAWGPFDVLDPLAFLFRSKPTVFKQYALDRIKLREPIKVPKKGRRTGLFKTTSLADQIQLEDPDKPITPFTGKPAFQRSSRPGENPLRKVKPWSITGRPSKGSNDFKPLRTWTRTGKFNPELHPRVAPAPGSAPKRKNIPKKRIKRKSPVMNVYSPDSSPVTKFGPSMAVPQVPPYA